MRLRYGHRTAQGWGWGGAHVTPLLHQCQALFKGCTAEREELDETFGSVRLVLPPSKHPALQVKVVWSTIYSNPKCFKCCSQYQEVPGGILEIKSFILQTLSEPISRRKTTDQGQTQRFNHPLLEIKVQKLFSNAAIKAVKPLSSEGKGAAMYANTRIKGSANSAHSGILAELMRRDTLWSCRRRRKQQ